MKRIFTLLFGAMLAGQAWAQTTFTVDKLKYTITGTSSVSVGAVSDTISGHIIIPAKVENGGVTYMVTSIGNSAFRGCENLTSISIGDCIKSIKGYAFYDCRKLTSITIPDSVTEIGTSVFWLCDKLSEINVESGNVHYTSENGILFSKDKKTIVSYPEGKTDESYDIPNTVTKIGYGAFAYSNLKTINIPESIISIDGYAFIYCQGITSIIIPDAVTSIGDEAFAGCSSLASISIGSGVNNMGRQVFSWCNKLTNVTLGNGITDVSSSAFLYANKIIYNEYDSVCYLGNDENPYLVLIKPKSDDLTSSEINSNCKIIANYAFDDFYNPNNLTSVTIPNSVTIIGKNAFDGCIKLKSVTIPSSVTTIGSYAFYNVRHIVYHGDATGQPWGAITNNGFVDEEGFVYSDAEKTQLIGYAGNGGDITIPNTVKKIGSRAFSEYSILTSVTIPNSVTTIGYRAFYCCSNLKSVTIPNSVKEIDGYAFYGCNSLTSVNLPNSVTDIGEESFAWCTKLMEINVDSENNYYVSVDGVLFNKDKTTIVCYPAGRTGTYTIPNSVTTIGDAAFEYTKLSSITIPSTVVDIEEDAFNSSDSLTYMIIPNSVTEIGVRAFYRCDNLTSLTIPNSVISIGWSAFDYCSKLKSVVCLATVPPVLDEDDPFASTGTVYVLPDCVDAYKAANVWKNKTILPINVESIDATRGTVYSYNNILYAEPKEGYHFVNWSDNSVENPRKTTGEASLTAQFEAHLVVMDSAIVATCTESGKTEGSHCPVCKVVLKAQEVVPAKGHTEVVDAAVAATCTATGLTEGKHCSVCKAVLKAQEVVPAKGHTVAVDAAVGATCTATGLTEGSHCSVCGEIIIAQTQTPMIEHTAVVDSAVAATCTESGLTEGSHCSVCGTILIAQTQTPMVEHTVVVDGAVAATCMESGKTEGSHCSVCGEVLVAQKEIPALGHEFVNYIYNNDATTAADGTETAVCEHGCGETDTRTAVGTKLTNTPVTETAANAVNIYAHGNTIVVENATDEISVYDAMGRLVVGMPHCDVSTEIRINTAGLYIVKVGNIAKRVMVN